MTKKIAIIGRHPTLEPGFNGGMSLNEALGFARVVDSQALPLVGVGVETIVSIAATAID